ncbi:MAG: apolipoprotein N-acyltransferase [Bacteriovoracaceae bacterium]|nr:apolipoprotein N-acyltransferase [Bacteriovoracaceae bacterium]
MKSLLLSLSLTTIAGGLYALCYPSFLGDGWLPLLFIALPFFLWRLEVAPTVKSTLLHILAYNLGLNLVGYYWIPHTLREFGQLPYVVSVILGLLFSLILQPHWWLYVLWKKYRPEFQWYSQKGILITALVMTIIERYFPQQFPSYVGSPWLNMSPYLGLTPYLGVVVFSFITYWVALETFTQLALKKLRPQVWVTLALFVLINALFPLKDIQSDKTLPVRIVQANIGNFLKIASERGDTNSYEAINKTYENLSNTANGFEPKLIIWPETAYPDTFYGQKTKLAPVFENIMKTTGSEMLIGGYDQDMTKSPFDYIESVFNSSILLSDNKVKTSYHKNILIPFGETLPFGPFNRQIVSIVPAVSLFARGEGTPVMELKGGERFVTPICYEILESNYMRNLLNQWGDNHLIINHTNDSWYGDTAEPHQHLFLTKWRALEFQLPIVRSTNTGISSVIYPDGSESKRLDVGTEGILDVNVPLGTGQATIYQTYGVFPLVGIFLILLLITWYREKR